MTPHLVVVDARTCGRNEGLEIREIYVPHIPYPFINGKRELGPSRRGKGRFCQSLAWDTRFVRPTYSSLRSIVPSTRTMRL